MHDADLRFELDRRPGGATGLKRGISHVVARTGFVWLSGKYEQRDIVVIGCAGGTRVGLEVGRIGSVGRHADLNGSEVA